MSGVIFHFPKATGACPFAPEQSAFEKKLTKAHKAGRGPWAGRPEVVELHAGYSREFRLWSVWAVDANGDQVGDGLHEMKWRLEEIFFRK